MTTYSHRNEAHRYTRTMKIDHVHQLEQTYLQNYMRTMVTDHVHQMNEAHNQTHIQTMKTDHIHQMNETQQQTHTGTDFMIGMKHNNIHSHTGDGN
ncbi:hypothetical protein PoB_001383200 [Plakobranchus ocellatus]|uniref:Uncharacterized protein n=1 Tax=Plakobranchus ocellatus TaxID=259542 RepID=A0AAV3YYC3_9GAST|nr:hypothetical protein PoB_001383200 [Plakobranchus ocellatus]